MRVTAAATLVVSLLVLIGSPAGAIAAVEVLREQVGNRITENVPAVPEALSEKLGQYQNTRGASVGGWLADGSLVIGTRFAETAQAHRLRNPLGMREQLTFFSEPVRDITTVPAGGNGFVYGRDEGGSEFWQLYWFDLERRESRLLSDGGRSQNTSAVFSADGRWLAWSSTARNGTDYDLWLRDMASGETRMVLAEGGMWRPLDIAADGSRMLVARYVSINESYPGVLSLAAEGGLRMFPVGGDKAAFGDFSFGPDGRSVYYTADEGHEFMTLFHHDPAGGAPTALSASIPWNVTGFRIAPDGRHLAYVTNEDGISRLHLLELPGHRPVAMPELPIGVIGGIAFAPDGRRLALTLNSATSPSDVHVVEFAPPRLTAWTASETGGLNPTGFIAPSLVRYPTFDEVEGARRTIPAFYYRPPGAGPFPVVINIHGGPEAQSLPVFDPITQFMLRELGIAVLVPNVRGSSGYGKQYMTLDNGMLREDSVRDIGALLDWVADQPELDAARVGVRGGSYGGYMVLASMIHYNERLRAGIDIVGISDFITFLANTESYRRDLRRAEYGDERDPEMAAFMRRISPLANAQKISRPLFVAQGANDPRVPASEAEQIVAKVRGNGGEVWYLLFDDEGHGFAKKRNADYFNAASMLLWQQHLLGDQTAQ
jgi:dipeptidyl aminopeptidase/acylaminoacyl peptidase